jgi:anti-sigma28 factor (negative regulator of flagellin synthesis)
MRVDNKSEIKGADTGQTRSASDRSTLRSQGDKVSVDAVKQVEAVVESVRTTSMANRTAQLQALESAIRQGTYQPDASRLAEKIIQAAELDARLRALMGD